jgi:CheY-like chemotaxis protein
MEHKTILLVEDNPDDVALTLRALRKYNIANEVVVTTDGAEALEYLFGTGKHAGRDLREMPALVLLDLKLPRVDGLMEAVRQLGLFWLVLNEPPPAGWVGGKRSPEIITPHSSARPGRARWARRSGY